MFLSVSRIKQKLTIFYKTAFHTLIKKTCRLLLVQGASGGFHNTGESVYLWSNTSLSPWQWWPHTEWVCPTEQNDSTTRMELIAVVEITVHFRSNIYSADNHQAVKVSDMPLLVDVNEGAGMPTCTIAGKAGRVQFHCRGRHHTNADVLSRRPC